MHHLVIGRVIGDTEGGYPEHTDNKRDFDYNRKLSQQHADAVVAALVEEFGISRYRITAERVANLAPVTYNASEECRGQNRRVRWCSNTLL